MSDTRAAGIYVRISDDRPGDGAGVARQEADSRDLATRLGWSVVDVFVENDRSAFKRRKVRLPDGTAGLRVVRPEFRRMLDSLTGGAIDAVVVYDLDRVARDPRDLEDLIDAVEATAAPIQSVTGSVDLATDAGVTMSRVLVAFANKSSRDTARRVTRKHLELAEQGKPGGGGIRAYGYTADGLAVVEREADVIAGIAAAILAGTSLGAIARDLTARGVPTVRGGPWTRRSVHSVVSKPKVAGLRTYRGEIVGPGRWPAILDRDVWERVRLALAGRAHNADNVLKRWLTGVLVCSLCGRPLAGSQGNSGPRYWCATPQGGCGKIAVTAGRAEDFIGDLIVRYLSRPDVLADIRAATSSASLDVVRRELADDEDQLRELAQLWAGRAVTTKEYLAARKTIEARLDQRRTVLRVSLPGAVREITGGDAAAKWAAMADQPAQRREVARIVFPQGVEVRPFGGGLARFDPRRLVPRGWKA